MSEVWVGFVIDTKERLLTLTAIADTEESAKEASQGIIDMYKITGEVVTINADQPTKETRKQLTDWARSRSVPEEAVTTMLQLCGRALLSVIPTEYIQDRIKHIAENN